MSANVYKAYDRNCSECGVQFSLPLAISQYQYKIYRLEGEGYSYQCSYTCHEHAKLRTKKHTQHLLKKNLKEYVKRSEDAMRAQGKEILHPIEIQDE